MSPALIRPARAEDASLIHQFICELAAYEQLAGAVTAKVEDIGAALFSAPVRARCEIAEIDAEPVGFALWFYNFSTFEGRSGLYLEDLFVRPEARGKGAGKALLARLARRCVEENLGRLDWAVLDWNAAPPYPSTIASARRRSANGIIRRLSGEALRALAAADKA